MVLEQLDRLLAQLELRFEFLGRDALEEIFGEKTDVLLAAAQRREVEADDVEPVKKILAELFFGHLGLEVFVCRGDDAHIGLDGLVAADAGERPVLQHAQEFALDGERHVADLVEKEGAAVALLEPADTLGAGPGEGTFFVTEEFAFEEIFRNGRAIDGKERTVVPRAVLVDGPGDEFLPRAAFAGDHDGGIAVRNAPDHFENLLHGGGLTDDAVLVLLEAEGGFEGFGQAHFGGGFKRGINHDFEIEGQLLLAHEIEGAEAHRFDDALRGAEGAGDDDQSVGIALAQAGKQFQTAVGAEPHFGDDHQGIFRAEKFEGLFGAFRGEGADIVGGELAAGPIEKIGIGIDDKNGLLCGHGQSCQMPP